MKTYAPDYYNDFKCIADKCKNSCCIGWEIDIDDETYDKYMSLRSPIGEKLRNNITTDIPHSFKLRENEKCPFLNENGLCELILTLGEDQLCDICALHPRYRNFYNTRTEIGLGLCCEAVGDIVLNKKTPTRLIVIDDDGETDVPDEAEEEIIKLRDNILSLLSDRTCSLDERVMNLLESFALPDAVLKLSEFRLVFSSLEYMSPKSLSLFSSVTDEKTLTEIEYEQILNYFVCRYLANSIDETEIRVYLAFALLSTNFISALAKNIPKTEACRLYSSEIEYNEENVEIIIEKICELIGE
ncbi:MAG: flagellin lysine-N-methylase [Clostridia bacterium]|nr:flagellin lysine-N-methylase [Clostridia bacterium]